jgi:uncharacterized protein YlxW (UPF0749 family)
METAGAAVTEPATEREGEGTAGRPLPDQVTMGLLAYLNAHSLDEDYADASRRRRGTGDAGGAGPGAGRRIGRYGAAALAVFAVLAVTAGAQTARNSSTDARERQELVEQIAQRKAAVADDRTRIEALRETNDRLESDRLRNDNTTTGIFNRLRLLEVRNGNVAVRGPGVRVVVDDAKGASEDERLRVLDTDLQHLANGLWEAGAEAIAINGERLTNTSAIRHAGSVITVNFRSLSHPYTVEAIGNPDTLPARFAETTSGQTWLDLQREIGLSFSMRTVRSMLLPGAPVRDLRFAVPAQKNVKRLP